MWQKLTEKQKEHLRKIIDGPPTEEEKELINTMKNDKFLMQALGLKRIGETDNGFKNGKA